MHTSGKKRTRALRRAVTLLVVPFLVAVAAIIGTAPKLALATHFRASALTWTRAPGSSNVSLSLSVSYRLDYPWEAPSGNPLGHIPNVGDHIVDPNATLHYGDNQTLSAVVFTVQTTDTADDTLTGLGTFTHTYATPGIFTAYYATCCRLSAPPNNGHMNNGDKGVQVNTVVDTRDSTVTSSPTSTLPPIIDCPKNSPCDFFVPATDANGLSLHYRFSNATEAGGGFIQPTGAAIDPVTGKYTWNTTGQPLAPSQFDTYYSSQVTVEAYTGTTYSAANVVSSVAVDFFLRITNQINNPPVFTDGTPADGTVINTVVNKPVTFNVSASDPDAGDSVNLEVINAPAGSTFTGANNPGDPASATFSWTPAHPGSVVLNLTAEDQFGLGTTPRSITINVAKASPTIAWPQPSAITYGTALDGTQLDATASDPTTGGSLAGTFTYTLADTTTPAGGAVLGAGNGQTLNVSFVPTDSTDYASASGSTTIDVNQAPLSVTANDKTMTYGDTTLPTFDAAVSGLVNGDTVTTTCSETDSSSNPVTVSSGTPAGTYTITCAVSGPDVANYNVTAKAGTLTIHKAVLTVTADNQIMTYGGPLPSLTASYSGFVNGDGSSTLGGSLNCQTTATASSPVQAGGYAIDCSGSTLSSNNYTIQYQPGTLTVTPAPLTVTASSPTSTYGDPVPAITAIFAGLVAGDSSASEQGKALCAATPANPVHAGAYPTGCTLNDPNYNPTYVPGTLTINKAQLTVTPADASRVYGASNPTFTSTISGFLNGDTQSVVSGSATCSSAATTSSDAGSYPITCDVSGLSATDYTFTSGTGTLNITKQGTTLTYTGPTLIAQGQSVTFSATLTGQNLPVASGDAVTFTLGSQTCTATVADSTGKVSCSIAASQALGPGQAVQASFGGDKDSASSSASKSIIVYSTLVSGSFVTGDRGAAVGASVTFWGAQWAMANGLSGGAAPASFKGFAASVSGSQWSTGPGNSAGAPGSVPAYMAVLVSSSITKTGSTISGNVVHVVIVKTNPGYGPDPGSAGTGTIVAQLS